VKALVYLMAKRDMIASMLEVLDKPKTEASEFMGQRTRTPYFGLS